MTERRSWREGVSAEAQEDLDSLLSGALRFAEQMLAKYGELYPFGASVTNRRTVRMLAADPGGEHPLSQDVLDALYAGAVSVASETRAVAFVSDVLADGADAGATEGTRRVWSS